MSCGRGTFAQSINPLESEYSSSSLLFDKLNDEGVAFLFVRSCAMILDVRRKRKRVRVGKFEVEKSKCDGKQLMKEDDEGVTFHKYGAK